MSNAVDGVFQYDPAQVADQLDATANLGPPLMGMCAQFYLFGMFASKFYQYVVASKQYKTDSRPDKIVVWLVGVLLVCATGVNAFTVAWHGCWQNRTLQSIYMVEVPDSLLSIFCGAIGATVQIFLAIRASRLFQQRPGRKLAFLLAVSVLVLFSFVAAIGVCVTTLSFTYAFQAKLLPFNFANTGTIWCALSAGADLLITVTLFLRLRGSIKGFNKSTDSAVARIMSVGLQTALPTTFFEVMAAILAIAWGNESALYSVVWISFSTPLASLYGLSLLVTLNSRKPIKRTRAVVGSSSWLPGSRASVEKRPRPSLAKRTISKMSIPQLVQSKTATVDHQTISGITFTRDVVEEVETSDEPAPKARRPYIESYLEPPRR